MITYITILKETLWKFFIVMVVYFGFMSNSNAQVENIMKALTYVKENNFDSARYVVDAASVHPETADSASTWYYRGFIYRELDKKTKKVFSKERELSIQYYIKSLQIQPTGKYSDNIKEQINTIASSYYNDVVLSLQKNDGDRAKKNFELYKQTLLLIKPNFDFKNKKIEFYSTLGSLYTALYENTGENNAEYWKMAKSAYNIVLKLDPENLSGNYNVGILYYNKAVNIINNQTYDITLATLNDIQDTSIVLFRKSLPYMKTALKYEPDNKHTLQGMAGIYFALNENEMVKEIREKLKNLNEGEDNTDDK